MRALATIAFLVSVSCGGAAETSPTSTEATSAPEPAEPALLPAEQILDDYVEATGGAAAHKAIKSRITRGRIQIPQLGMSGTYEMWQQEPNLATMRMELPSVGETRIGFDGETMWTTSPAFGARIITGTEREQLLRDFHVHADAQWREIYDKAKTLSRDEDETEELWRVELTTAAGQKRLHWYSVERKLLVKSEQTAETQMGPVKSVSQFSAYKDFDGVLMSTKVVQKGMGQSQELLIDSVEHNTEIEPSVFVPPEEIKALQATSETPESGP